MRFAYYLSLSFATEPPKFPKIKIFKNLWGNPCWLLLLVIIIKKIIYVFIP